MDGEEGAWRSSCCCCYSLSLARFFLFVCYFRLSAGLSRGAARSFCRAVPLLVLALLASRSWLYQICSMAERENRREAPLPSLRAAPNLSSPFEGRKKGGDEKDDTSTSLSEGRKKLISLSRKKKLSFSSRTPPSTRSSSASSTPAPAGPAAPSPSPRPRSAPSASPRGRS